MDMKWDSKLEELDKKIKQKEIITLVFTSFGIL